MDNTAIKEIGETALAASKVEGTKYAVKALPDRMSLHSLEEFQEFRNRFRGRFSTNSLPDFVSYVVTKQGKNCFVDAEGMAAKTIFNLGTEAEAGHADNIAVLTLTRTAPYAELLSHNERVESQRNLSEWIEDWRDNIQVIDEDGKDMTVQAASAAIRRITIEAVRKQGSEARTFGETKSSLESIDAKSDDGTMPAWIVFTCKPYEDLSDVTFHSRISIKTGGEKPSLVTRIVQFEMLQEEMANEFKGKLNSEFSKEIEIYLGSFTK